MPKTDAELIMKAARKTEFKVLGRKHWWKFKTTFANLYSKLQKNYKDNKTIDID